MLIMSSCVYYGYYFVLMAMTPISFGPFGSCKVKAEPSNIHSRPKEGDSLFDEN